MARTRVSVQGLERCNRLVGIPSLEKDGKMENSVSLSVRLNGIHLGIDTNHPFRNLLCMPINIVCPTYHSLGSFPNRSGARCSRRVRAATARCPVSSILQCHGQTPVVFDSTE